MTSGSAVVADRNAQAASASEQSSPLTSSTGLKPKRRRIVEVTVLSPRLAPNTPQHQQPPIF